MLVIYIYYSIYFIYILYIYINDLSNNIDSNIMIFIVSLWADKWKMFCNPDPSKQAQKVIFS